MKRGLSKAREKYRRMFETQKTGNKTISGDIGLNIRTRACPKLSKHRSEI